jgi:hypothetical protein
MSKPTPPARPSSHHDSSTRGPRPASSSASSSRRLPLSLCHVSIFFLFDLEDSVTGPSFPPRALTHLLCADYAPLYFQIRGSSATMSGIELMPFSVGTACVSIITGFIVSKVSPAFVTTSDETESSLFRSRSSVVARSSSFLTSSLRLASGSLRRWTSHPTGEGASSFVCTMEFALMHAFLQRKGGTLLACRRSRYWCAFPDTLRGTTGELDLALSRDCLSSRCGSPLTFLSSPPQACMPISEMATSTSTIGLLRSLGGTTGISIGGRSIWSAAECRGARVPNPLLPSLAGAIYASELKKRLAPIVGYTVQEGSVLAGDVLGLSKIEASPSFAPCSANDLDDSPFPRSAHRSQNASTPRVHPFPEHHLDYLRAPPFRRIHPFTLPQTLFPRSDNHPRGRIWG